ncbi:MAG TPA: alpha/beta hydrolase [Burkholderiaceae bacterium]
MQTTFVHVADTRIAVHSSEGRGPALVLVHGNSASARAFDRQLNGPLGRALRVVAIDLPGHGQSEDAADPQAVYSLPGFASVLEQLAGALELRRAVFAGWSLGGHIVLEAAPRLREAAGFCIFGTPPLAWPPAMDQAFLPDPSAPILFQEHYTEDEVRLRAEGMVAPGAPVPAWLPEDIRRSDGRFRAMLAASLGSVGLGDEVVITRELRQPLAVLHGAHDRVVNAGYIAALTLPTLWRGALQTLPQAGHMPQWEDSASFDALLQAFVEDCAKPTRARAPTSPD